MLKSASAFCAAMALAIAPASAAKIDLGEFARLNGGGVANGATLTVDGVTITFTAGGALGEEGAGLTFFPYFDDYFQGRAGGLGVCRALDIRPVGNVPGGDCQRADRAGISGEGGVQEFIMLSFEDPYNVNAISFRDGAHNPINQSAGRLRFFFAFADQTFASGLTTFADLTTRAAAGEFQEVSAFSLGYVDTAFYIDSISDMPIPGGAILLISGLGGLAFAARRRNRSA